MADQSVRHSCVKNGDGAPAFPRTPASFRRSSQARYAASQRLKAWLGPSERPAGFVRAVACRRQVLLFIAPPLLASGCTAQAGHLRYRHLEAGASHRAEGRSEFVHFRPHLISVRCCSSMPWKCPACGTPIRHSDAELKPRVGAHYRCHICRLELVVDPSDEKLTVAPMDDDERGTSRSKPE